MKRYWNDAKVYEQPDFEMLKEKARQSMSKARTKGREYEPIVPKSGRGEICESWWGQAWCRNLESYADYESRLDRGKRYLRNGTVIDLKIKNGHVEAKVQGRRKNPYKVEIRIGRLSEEACQKVISRCNRRIDSVEALVKGEFPEELKDIFTSEGGLFPRPQEIQFSCSCPDWAMMCKHVAAVLYGIGVKFDENPFFFFSLRGIDIDRFLDVAVQSRVENMLSHANCRTARMLDDGAVGALFGVI
ncbi:MAG: hypothetical protein Q4A32_12100 [Lachnospiraceae bacterium]|nr:hypothetical protein [Lachnospiraceae bacterium]